MKALAPPGSRWRELVVLAAIGLWAAYGTVTQARMIWAGLEASRQRHASITAHLRLFAQVRPDIAEGEVVAYVSSSDGGADYYLARYALSPPLLLEDIHQARKLIVFYPRGIPRTLPYQEWRPVRSYGNGLFLLERRTSP